MRPKSIIKTIETAVKLRQPVYLEGPPGVGKSSYPLAAAKNMGADVILFPSAPTLDAVDIRGIPRVITAEDCKEFGISENLIGNTVTFPPDFLPRKVDKLTIVVIDDIPTANQSVQAALLQLLLDRKIGSYIVPDNISFVLTGNRVQDKTGASRTLTALDSRVLRIQAEIDLSDWLEWAAAADIAPEIRAFHRHYGGKYLWSFDATKKCNPLPRTWEKTSEFFKVLGFDDPNIMEIIAGLVGEEAAQLFVGFSAIVKKLVAPAVIFAKPDTATIPDDPGALLVTLAALSRAVERPTLEAFMTYLERLPSAEYLALAVTDAVAAKPALKESKVYVNYIRKYQV